MRKSLLALALISTALPFVKGSALAQDAPIETRVYKLEKEMNAVQRKVFPNGAPVQPEITQQQPGAVADDPGGNASALTGVNQRIDLLESQLRAMTGQIERNEHETRLLSEASKAQEARIVALEQAAKAPPPVIAPPPAPPKPVPPQPAPVERYEPLPPAPPVIRAPNTGDPQEDAYSYGYRLFAAGQYADAETKLSAFVLKYPQARRFSFAQNLLGRAYFNEGKYGLAARALVENYTKLPTGERAAESLSWAGQALINDNLPAKACRIYDEFDSVFGANANADILARVAKGRVDAKCGK